MKRGDLLTIALQGDYGKPRPAVVVQNDGASSTDSILVCPTTSDLAPDNPLRIRLAANEASGLRHDSDVMIDKVGPVPRVKCGPVFGRVSEELMPQLNEALTFILGLGE